ncbi:DNA mismatch repair protein MutT [Chryseotalea sanaruensis]|uniref:DNA mismatch repair protein MutT n=2 Tax=Chryseotalea sanaruensis TaxID=2482724 RepID=A0A401UEV7_9BACT|nr:DNA mismatch repair protein MutT [Chryseotalea sanaruensis]
MLARMLTFSILIIVLLLVDYYVFQAVVQVSKNLSEGWKLSVRLLFWLPTLLTILIILFWTFGNPYSLGPQFRNWAITGIVGVYFSKFFAVLVLFIDDIQRGIRWMLQSFSKEESTTTQGEVLTRSEFLSKTALIAAAIPFGTMAYGIISGAHDYRIKRVTLRLPNLPQSFDGIKIGHISDIHSGSFFNKTAVKGGVEMLMNEKPDAIFFTGDLVNNESEEVKDYINIFDKLKAPLGVYSVTGNHDYGDYKKWASAEAKRKNFSDLMAAHKQMNFDLLMNENRFLQIGTDKIAVIGIENWGGGGFAKYGKLDEAYRNTNEAAVKLLLSHDPSHWDAQVKKDYQDIDLMFSGHTHGFQFGVEIGDFKWSPSQYAYKQWAGLYSEGNQHLYVNRGFGYIGYPGRIGMPPELTILELKRA